MNLDTPCGPALLADIRARWKALDAGKVDMDYYFFDRVEEAPVDSLAALENGPHSCGTTACLAGWLQVWYATEPKERECPAYLFGETVLARAGIEPDVASAMIQEGVAYGRSTLSEVTHHDVLMLLECNIDFIEANVREALSAEEEVA